MKSLDKMWKVLQEAKKHLAWSEEDELKTGKNEFICNAISTVCTNKDNFYITCNLTNLYRIIQERLKHEITYQAWLINHKHITIEEYDADTAKGYPIRQLSRHVWVDSMIKEFKKKDI